MKKIFLLAALAALLASCGKDNGNDWGGPDPNICEIDFEDVPAAYLAGPAADGKNLYHAFGAGQYVGYTDATRGLKFVINEDSYSPGQRNFWAGGVAISQWNDMAKAGADNQCSVYFKDSATGFGGYNGSKTFAVNNGNGTVELANPAAEVRFIDFKVNNATFACLSMLNGDQYAKKFELGDWFKLIITATDAAGAATGDPVEFYLADMRTVSSPGIVTKWTTVGLEKLGAKVHKIHFAFDSSDNGEYGMNTPAYFCFDNLAYIVEPQVN